MHILQCHLERGGIFMLACCFVGHRNTKTTPELAAHVKKIVIDLIKSGVETFYFGSKSMFDYLCYDVVTTLKRTYPHIRRVYVRAEYDYAPEEVKYFLDDYEDTFMPAQVKGSGRAAYVKRNQFMVDASEYCVFYCNPEYMAPPKKAVHGLPPKAARSGTQLAYQYAISKNKRVFNLFQN